MSLSEVKKNIPSHVCLLVVSKTHSVEKIEQIYQEGQRHFGENKAQEMRDKHSVLSNDIYWHFIGHLQTNKIKYIAPFVHLIHGIDSYSLLEAVNKEAKKNNRIIDCLLQFFIAQEETKFGLSYQEACELLESESYRQLSHVRIVGVMGMATFTENRIQIKKEFSVLKKIFDNLQKTYFSTESSFKEISMGMSDDYLIAIEEGSTMVRIGSAIFGHRDYTI